MRVPPLPLARLLRGGGTKRRSPTRLEAFDPNEVPIESGIPIPPAVGRGAPDRSRILLERMKPGQRVVLPLQQAKSLTSKARKLGIKVEMRRLADDTGGVWRVS
ncbi:MAG: hypothetical protein Q8R98_12105 [Rubrivivax sp.]|nr:hypothetical protein [Rubrivivax sp.]MDP3612589.1 hypothetical protein [Rubrivivax sp.]